MTQVIHTHKKLLALFLIIATLSCCCIPAAASDDVMPIGSDYLTSYGATLSTSGSKIYVDYTVVATGTQDEVGVFQIAMQQQQTDGTWKTVSNIYGADNSGMIAYNAAYNFGTYTYYGSSGYSYRAIVTVFAGGDYGSDAKIFYTNTVTTS